MASEEVQISKYKQQFLQKYDELLESISAEHFEEFNRIAPKQRVFEIFKAGLLKNILSYFNTVWDFTDTDEHLHVLELLKKDARNDPDKKWRPTGKSVGEQTRPLVVNKLKWQIKFYEKQIQFQKQQLERAVTQVEAGRKKWTDLEEKRKSTKAVVTSELQDFKRIEAQIMNIEDKLIHDLQR